MHRSYRSLTTEVESPSKTEFWKPESQEQVDQVVIFFFCTTLVCVNTPSSLISGISCLDKQVPLFDCNKNMDEDARLLCVFAKI